MGTLSTKPELAQKPLETSVIAKQLSRIPSDVRQGNEKIRNQEARGDRTG
jgi:hypothetical protein